MRSQNDSRININVQADLKSTAKQDEVLTNGNGAISISRAKQIRDKLGLDYLPAFFQGRLGPAKGAWLVLLRSACTLMLILEPFWLLMDKGPPKAPRADLATPWWC